MSNKNFHFAVLARGNDPISYLLTAGENRNFLEQGHKELHTRTQHANHDTRTGPKGGLNSTNIIYKKKKTFEASEAT